MYKQVLIDVYEAELTRYGAIQRQISLKSIKTLFEAIWSASNFKAVL